MRVVLDTNVLLSALMRDGLTHTLLLYPDLDVVMPEFALEEVYRYLPSFAKRMGIATPQARLTVELLLGHVETVPHEDYSHEIQRADEILRDVDPDDAPFAARAFATSLPIWTQDNALQNCKGISTISTMDLAKRLGVLVE